MYDKPAAPGGGGPLHNAPAHGRVWLHAAGQRRHAVPALTEKGSMTRRRVARLARRVVFLLLPLACLSAAAQTAPAARDTAGRALLFATPDLTDPEPAAGRVRLEARTLALDLLRLHPARGTVVVRLVPREPFGGFQSQFTVYPGPPHIDLRLGATWQKGADGKPDPASGVLACTVRLNRRYAVDGNPDPREELKGGVDLRPGEPLHVAWTWSGVRHCLYVNGRLAAAHVAATPFPHVIPPPARIAHNYPAADFARAPFREVAVYDFAMTADEAAANAAGDGSQPLVPAAPQPASCVAQWAPGERRAYVAVDAGTGPAGAATRAEVVLRGADGQPRARRRIGTLRNGFAETLVALPEMSPDRYRAEVSLQDEAGRELARVESEPWVLEPTEWLHNTRGLSTAVQPPWTPVEADADAVRVWGREYRLAGGFGLPQRIVSQGRDWLEQPVRLEIVQQGRVWPPRKPRTTLLSAQPHEAKWWGETTMGRVRVQLLGRVEYDGMVLVRLRLSPALPGRTVAVDAIRLHTVMPQARALFLNTSTDQGYWWYPHKGWIPRQPGPVLTNLQQRGGATTFLFYTLFCDHDTGLEWFADDLAGWQVDERKPVQEIVREENGTVRLTCHLANRPFELSGPIDLEFGYDATPVKPLPPDWRSTYVHYAALPGIPHDRALWWLWSDSRFDKFRDNVFLLQPDDPTGFAAARRALFQGIRLAPFTNQHVLLPAGPDRRRDQGGWPWFNHLLGAETENDGWTAVPTRGFRDYWAWNLDAWLAAGGLEAIYIDEANCQTTSASLLTGAGYVRPDGTHGVGHHTLGMREQLKRTRQLFLDRGLEPMVWIPVYGKIIPHAHAFADVVSEGEAFMFDQPDGPDWIDQWGAGLLADPPAGAGAWLLALGPARKFGFTPVFLDYLKFWDKPEYPGAVRAQYALLALLDIIPINPSQAWFFKAKQDFGMREPETAFVRYFDQRRIVADRADVQISYYRRGDHLLLVVANLGREAYAGPLHLDLPALHLAAGPLSATLLDAADDRRHSTAVRAEPLPLTGDTIPRLDIPGHDFRVVRVAPAADPPPPPAAAD